MNIAILTDGIYPFVVGGMQRHSFYMSKFLALRGHSITLVHCVPNGTYPLPNDEDLKEHVGEEASKNIRSICIAFPESGILPGHYLKESYVYSSRVLNAIRNELGNFDFIYSKGFAGWRLIEEKCKGMKCAPIGVKFHGYEMFQPAPDFLTLLKHFLLRSPVKWINKNADFVFSYGGKISEIITRIGVSPEKIVEVTSGIESDFILQEGKLEPLSGKRSLVFIGRFERRKGVQELTNVLVSLLTKRTDFLFHFIGPVPHSKRIKHEAIKYHGEIKDKKKILSILDSSQILVTPSHSEGMPNVILEGMARGLAVIATDVGAVSLQVDRKNGWLIKPSASGELSLAILESLKITDEFLNNKRKASLQRVRSEFRWEEVAIRLERAITDAIGK